MKNDFARRMYIAIFISVLAASIGVYTTLFVLTYTSTTNELRERSYGVRDFVLRTLTFRDFADVSLEGEAGDIARRQVQGELNQLRYVGNLERLYIAALTDSGDIITSLNIQNPDGSFTPYVPTGMLEADLRRSLDDRLAISGSNMYSTELGRVYSVFWPILNEQNIPVAVVGMEFDVDFVYQSLFRMGLFTLGIAIALITIITTAAYLSMYKTSEPFYKKMAYLDFLTGLQNRLAYEQRLVFCEGLIPKGVNVTIIIFDVNNLKTINDTLGHRHGDTYILNTARVIAELVGNLGHSYRIGGDEFAAIIVNQEKESIAKLLDKFRKEKRPVLNKLPFDCAFGAATFTYGVDDSLNDLAARADREMYREKQLSKSRSS